MKKTTSLLLVFMLLIGMLAGCAKTETETPDAPVETPVVSEPAEEPVVEDDR